MGRAFSVASVLPVYNTIAHALRLKQVEEHDKTLRQRFD